MLKQIILTVLLSSWPLWISAQEVRQISWEDLRSNEAEFDDPFERLSESQLRDLSYVARMRNLIKLKPGSLGPETVEELAGLEKRLNGEGIDIDGLIARREEIAELRKKRAEAVVDSLNGKLVRMAGYLLPLDFKGKLATEFLLVPWVGACIHTPPPPKNQIIYVHFEEGVPFKSQFDPVWIEGVMTTTGMAKELFLVDGSSRIDSGYSMSAKEIEDYSGE